MKKSSLFLAAIIGIIIGALAAFAYNQYATNNAPGDELTGAEDTSTEVYNPQFNDVESFMCYATELSTESKIDSILTNTPDQILAEIASVCIKKYGSIDRATLYREYNNNYNDVYKYLNHDKPVIDPTSTPDNKQGGNQAVITQDTVASAAVVIDGTTKVTGQ